jgi:predicted AlkP superfamily phosphohydrolase/phosphomutase
VFLNTWLAQEGFLTFKPRERGHGTRARLNRARRVLDHAGLDTRTILAWARRIGGDAALRFGGEKLSRFASEIDWEHTQAYCHGTNAIRLNLRGREPHGSVDPAEANAVLESLRARLLALRDPEGERIITGVQTREDLYTGPEVALAADLLITHHDDSVWFYYSEGTVPERIFEPSGWASGNHEPDGLFLAWGPDFSPGARIEDANIVDILPTMFATMGVPIPDDVDGRVLHEVLTHRAPVRWTEAEAYRPSATAGERTADADRAIEERLRGLGYLQ